jgi:3-hydroxybutyryl-CoA dehydrogenase
MAALLPPHTLIGTNSSTLLPRDFADATGRPEKFCALHFANLIWSVNLVEVMAHARTSADTLTSAMHFVIEIGQVPIPVQKEQNRYVLNSWLVPLMTAALTLVVKGVATAEDVDRTYMIANRRCAMGPCGIADVVGMKTIYDISSYWGALRGDAQMLENASYIRERFLDKGLQGMLGGEGFYRYPDPAYAAAGFLAVPAASSVPELVARAILK